jgi:hypothetical protein
MKDKRDRLFKAFLAKNARKKYGLYCIEFSEIVLSDRKTVKAFKGNGIFIPFCWVIQLTIHNDSARSRSHQHDKK